VKETPGEVVKRWRSVRGRVSQETLAEQIRAGGYRISMSMLSSIERNKDRPSRDTAEAIDQALDADGEITAAFGFIPSSRSTAPARLDALEAQVDALTLVVEQLGQVTLERLGEHVDLVATLAELAELRARLRAR
jgi:transcriptional regulator with XRE-family HTH domain